jgi:hypothetical protein
MLRISSMGQLHTLIGTADLNVQARGEQVCVVSARRPVLTTSAEDTYR